MFGRFAIRLALVGVVGAGLLLSAPQARAGDTLTTYGDIGQFAIPVIAGITAIVKEDDYQGLLQLGVGSAVTMGVTHGLKFTVDRERPDGNGGKSFPSGHTAAAFMGASFLHYRYGWEYGLPSYAAAAVVGYSRIAADKHHWEDVVAAAVIANISAYIFTDTLDDNVVIVPFADIGKKNFGITAGIKF